MNMGFLEGGLDVELVVTAEAVLESASMLFTACSTHTILVIK